ncbi:MAG: UTP--glucose-1-phosphate uridylyltransferase [Candidatus Margulisiibacteriota bacterium]
MMIPSLLPFFSNLSPEQIAILQKKESALAAFPDRLAIAKQALPLCLEKISQKFPVSSYTATQKDTVLLVFCRLYLAFLTHSKTKIPWPEIEPLRPEDTTEFSTLTPAETSLGHQKLGTLCCLKLNGGLGTTMGCQGAKSAIPIHEKQTFLDVIAQQLLDLKQSTGTDIPLLLMNSSYTQEETRNILEPLIAYTEFFQHEFPRIDRNNGFPFHVPSDPSLDWTPCGHGDMYLALSASGVLDRLMNSGHEFLFVSNVDNLGATPHPAILGHMIAENLDFVMETTPKTKADVKGGTLIRHHNTLTLLERAQVEDLHLQDFEDITTFPLFNTNSIWIRLSALKEALHELCFKLPIITNHKVIHDHRITQLETAMGAGIAFFQRAKSIVVPRDRFLPVKKTSDLLVLQSDCIQKKGCALSFSNPNAVSYPTLHLSHHFERMSDYQHRIQAVPSLKEATDVTLDGDIILGKNVVFKGRVTVYVKEGKTLKLENRVLDNETLVF